MIRAVFDTNIVISAWLWSGAPRQALAAVEREQVKLFISEVMLDELKEVISRPKFADRLRIIAATPEQLLTRYLMLTEVIEASPIKATIKADPDDDTILACALAGKANYIVTGDPHLLELKVFEQIPIVNVNHFLELLTKE